MTSLNDAKLLITLAREAILSVFLNQEPAISQAIKKRFSKKQGGFVTLEKENQLRGCIGYLEPLFPLWETIYNAAIAAAFKDIRFPPLQHHEVEEITVEISLLTPPQLMKEAKEKIPEIIVIGKHGLIIEHPEGSGVLLPQVPVEWGWTAEEFLKELCHKAGLPSYAWRDKEAKLYAFSAEIFKEKTPQGDVEKIDLSKKMNE